MSIYSQNKKYFAFTQTNLSFEVENTMGNKASFKKGQLVNIIAPWFAWFWADSHSDHRRPRLRLGIIIQTYVNRDAIKIYVCVNQEIHFLSPEEITHISRNELGK